MVQRAKQLQFPLLITRRNRGQAGWRLPVDDGARLQLPLQLTVGHNHSVGPSTELILRCGCAAGEAELVILTSIFDLVPARLVK